MDDMAAYYPPPPGTLPTYVYYPAPPPPPQPPAAAAPPPPQPYLSHLHQAPFPSYGAPLASHGSYDEVRTLFVAGLPEDVKAREIYNLFREFPGYESSHLRSPSKNSQPFAFAVFSDQQSAVAAMHALNGMVFDLEKGSTLYIDLAKSNSRSKRLRDEDRHGSDKRAKLSSPFSFGALDSGVGSTHMPGMGNSAYSTIGYPSTQRSLALLKHILITRNHILQQSLDGIIASSGKVEGFVEATTAFPVPCNHGSSDGRGIKGTTAAKTGNSSAPPCPTLFVANLGPRCTEQELIQVFSQCSGFLKLKMQGTYGAPVAFVDFQDTACSTEALNQLQGTLLHSSPAGDGIRLEYAKSRMGMRRKGK